MVASEKDFEWADKIKSELEGFGIPSRRHVASAHKTPEDLLEIIKVYEQSIEPIVFIASAGLSDALSGMISANTRFPVIACPPNFNPTDIFSSLKHRIQCSTDG